MLVASSDPYMHACLQHGALRQVPWLTALLLLLWCHGLHCPSGCLCGLHGAHKVDAALPQPCKGQPFSDSHSRCLATCCRTRMQPVLTWQSEQDQSLPASVQLMKNWQLQQMPSLQQPHHQHHKLLQVKAQQPVTER